MSRPSYLSPTQILLVNESTVLSTNDVRTMSLGLNIALADFCYTWGIQPAQTYFPINGVTLSPMIPSVKTYTVTLSDLADISGAYGYHSDMSGNAKVFAKTILDAGGGVLASTTSALSVAQVVSYEVFEMLSSTLCNSWWITPTGTYLYGGNVCDAVQGRAFTVMTEGHAVAISDYILPAWCIPGSTVGPYNKANTLTAPFTLTTGGYCIRVTFKSATVSYVFGSGVPDSMKQSKNSSLVNDPRFAELTIV